MTPSQTFSTSCLRSCGSKSRDTSIDRLGKIAGKDWSIEDILTRALPEGERLFFLKGYKITHAHITESLRAWHLVLDCPCSLHLSSQQATAVHATTYCHYYLTCNELRTSNTPFKICHYPVVSMAMSEGEQILYTLAGFLTTVGDGHTHAHVRWSEPRLIIFSCCVMHLIKLYCCTVWFIGQLKGSSLYNIYKRGIVGIWSSLLETFRNIIINMIYTCILQEHRGWLVPTKKDLRWNWKP